jgi:FixJ family two-component response regulator
MLPMYMGVILSSQRLGNTDVGRSLLISIVDDDESVRKAIDALVRSLGYLAATFASAEEFLNSDRLIDTSCLITDLRMPGMSGVELQCRLIAQGRAIPTIFITAFADESTRARVLTAGAVGFLSKPFNEESLLNCLDKALNGLPRAASW